MIELHDKSWLDPFLQQNVTPFSDYTFANLYLWGKLRAYELYQTPFPHIIGHDNGLNFCQPLIGFNFEAYRDLLKEKKTPLYPLDEKAARCFSDSEFVHNSNPDWDTYLYRVEKLADYPGRHLDGKRNLVTQFKKQTRWSFRPFLPEDQNQALELLERWRQQVKKPGDYPLAKEAIVEANNLGLTGWVLLSGNKIIAFALVSPVTPSVLDFHFVKGDINYKGVYPMLYQLIAQEVRHQYAWISLENDLGIEGLRKSKESYFPDVKGQKWCVSLKSA